MPLINEEDYKIEAYMRLLPNGFNFSNGTVSDYSDELPTDEKLQETIDDIKAEYASQVYARKRKEEYDALNQLEMQFDDKEDGTTTWEDAIKAIKTKWPKDNSGPV